MKKLAIIATIALALTSCATKEKTLVAYFSASGNTKAVAEQLANVAGADLFEIKPAVAYTEADLDYRNRSSRSVVEMMDKSSRPAVAEKVKDLKKYTVVYIGFPVWGGAAPTIVNTFIEENDLKGKTVIPFITSGSSSIDSSEKQLQQTYPDLNWKPGKRLNGATEEVLKEFVGK